MVEFTVSQRCVCAARPCIKAPTGPGTPIDRLCTPTSWFHPTPVIDSQSGPRRWEARPRLIEPPASQRVTRRCWRGRGGGVIPAPTTPLQKIISGEAFTVAVEEHSLREQITATPAAALTWLELWEKQSGKVLAFVFEDELGGVLRRAIPESRKLRKKEYSLQLKYIQTSNLLRFHPRWSFLPLWFERPLSVSLYDTRAEEKIVWRSFFLINFMNFQLSY